MLRIRPYPLVSALLGCIFCIFTVGIPVVLASCPMTRSQGQERSCCPGSSTSSVPVIGAYKNASCCTTIVVAARSTSEYVQSAACIGSNLDVDHMSATLAVVTPTPVSTLASRGFSTAPSPPFHRPLLPVLYSALLI